METRDYEAALRIDHEAVKAYALHQRSDAIDATWKQFWSNVTGLVDGLRLDTNPADATRLADSGPSRQPG
jgi:hypothetical protein